MFLSVLNKKLNWEISTKNLVNFKRCGIGLMMKNFNIMRVQWKIRFLMWGMEESGSRSVWKIFSIAGGGSESVKKGGLWKFADLRGGLAKKEKRSNDFLEVGLGLCVCGVRGEVGQFRPQCSLWARGPLDKKENFHRRQTADRIQTFHI